ncbi:MAG: hypothetical protein IJQ08_04995 [Synergistaceae bacterium]|nr:hypothetical protein [Synergistaceae bacterium]
MRERLKLIVICAVAYFVMDVPVQMTQILPSYAGIKNFLPSVLGLFFGICGVIGCVIGCVLSSCIVNPDMPAVIHECFCITAAGLIMFYGWHITAKTHRPSLKSWPDYARYIVLLAGGCMLCASLPISAAYFLTGLTIGIPVTILFSSLLYIEPIIPRRYTSFPDVEFCLLPNAESLEGANELLEMSAMKRDVKMKRVLEIQSCIEELAIRIRKNNPDAKISVSVIFGEAISARLHYGGKKYNPFRIDTNEDEIDIMSLKIIKHRAIRASFSYSGGENFVHVVV